MFRILGNVTVKETADGIPNLVVALFDTDQEQLDLTHLSAGGPEGARVDRIGSVLTDVDGRFEFTFEREDFQIGDQERRPDLVLVVFAPEDSRSPEEPSPLKPEERILHVSRLPRQDAGRTEAWAIRLLKAQLERFEVPVDAARSMPDAGQYVAAVQRIWDFQDAVKEQLRPRLQGQASTARALARRAREKLAGLSAVPLAMRQHPLFAATPAHVTAAQSRAVELGLERLSRYDGSLHLRLSEADVARLNSANGDEGGHRLEIIDGRVEGEAEASAVLAIVAERSGGLDRVRGRSLADACVPLEHPLLPSGGEAPASAGALIPLTGTIVAAAPGAHVSVALRMEDPRGRPLAGIDVEFSVAEGGGFVSPAIGRTDARGRASATWILGGAEGLQVLTAAAAGAPGVTFTAAAAGSAAVLSTEEAESRLLELVVGQVQELRAAEAIEPLPARPDQQKVQEAVRSLALEGGPADATAYHDFHVLQVAFKHVWSEAFDARLKWDAERLYAETVRIAEHVGVEDDVLSAEIEALEDLISVAEDTATVYPDPPDAVRVSGDVPTYVVVDHPEVDPEVWPELWAEMTEDERRIVRTRSGAYKRQVDHAIAAALIRLEVRKARARATAEAPHDEPQDDAVMRFPRLRRLLERVKKRLVEPYAFDVFAPGSYNFGIITTYRQKWEPLGYQAGDLVATVPLAPGETRKFTKKEVIRRSRAEKEIARAMSSRSEELSEARRAEAEIMRKASSATNFRHTAEGSFSIGLASLAGSAEFALNQAEESANNKKEFRESTLKGAQAYKQERELQIESTSSSEIESTTSGEISNPNNELTVTYLFYELQRRYRISESIHRVRPVILVAQDVPGPHEIDEEWLLAHEWILRRVILDDTLLPALDYLSDTFAGDEAAIAIHRANWEKQRALVEKLEAGAASQLAMRNALREALTATALGRDLSAARESTTAEDVGALLTGGPATLLFGSRDEERTERLEAQRKAAETRLEYAEKALADAQAKLTHASDAFAQASREYTAGVQRQMNQRTAIDQLRIHVKQNVLYYMQAIWDHEPADQRFFRLYRLKVKCPAPGEDCVAEAFDPAAARHLGEPMPDPLGHVPGAPGTDRPSRPAVFRLRCRPAISGDEVDLVEIADVDSPLGYKGNYIIFPLKTRCYLTDYMMQEYVDDYFGVRDPDGFGDFSIEELAEYIGCVWHADGVTAEDRASLRDLFIRRLSEPRRSSDEIVVPSGQLFIEALPGRHPLLEDFKLRHRMEDVRKVQAEVRHAELENLRLAARLVAGEREDPEIEKRVLIDRDSGLVVDTE